MVGGAAAGSVAGEAVHELRRGSTRVEVTVDSTLLAREFGPRFDRCGVVSRFEVEGRGLLHPFGLPDEFGLDGVGVLGFDEAGATGIFVKVGVGVLRRQGPEKYFFGKRYPMEEAFPIAVTNGGDWLESRQESGSTLAGYGYRYVKTYRVLGDGVLRIEYSLENIGGRALRISHYNHNFLRLGGVEPGPEYVVTPSLPSAALSNRGFLIEGRDLRPAAGGSGYLVADLSAVPSELNRVRVVARSLTLEITGGFAPTRFAVWMGKGALSPEVFGVLVLQSGQSAHWWREYRAAVIPEPS
jgi:hypothetical protein